MTQATKPTLKQAIRIERAALMKDVFISTTGIIIGNPVIVFAGFALAMLEIGSHVLD